MDEKKMVELDDSLMDEVSGGIRTDQNWHQR